MQCYSIENCGNRYNNDGVSKSNNMLSYLYWRSRMKHRERGSEFISVENEFQCAFFMRWQNENDRFHSLRILKGNAGIEFFNYRNLPLNRNAPTENIRQITLSLTFSLSLSHTLSLSHSLFLPLCISAAEI